MPTTATYTHITFLVSGAALANSKKGNRTLICGKNKRESI